MAARFFLNLQFDGRYFSGWQKQKNAASVQETIEKGIKKISNEEISLTGAGRTDAGVHAKVFFAHFDFLMPQFDPEKFCYQLNAVLPDSIAIRRVFAVPENAHARFDAVRREYMYYIHMVKNPFLTGKSYFFPKPLDIAAMNEAMRHLKGKHDFSSFAKAGSQTKTNFCEIFNINWKKYKQGCIFTVTADRFLRNMVRALVGTSIEFGTHKKEPAEIMRILQKKDRCNAGASVPGYGLFLTKIQYPQNITE